MFAVALTFLWLKVLGCPGICMLMDCYQGREGGRGEVQAGRLSSGC